MDESTDQPILLFSTMCSAFEKYGFDHGLPLLLQTLARYLYLIKEDFEEAESTIGRAISMKPNNGTFYDTLGQISKQRLRRVVKVTNHKEIDINSVFLFSYEALTNFEKAQTLLQLTIEKDMGILMKQMSLLGTLQLSWVK